MFHALQEKVCKQKQKKRGNLCCFLYFGYMVTMLEKSDVLIFPRLLERKCIWRIHLIKAVLADENWRRNKISASLAKLLLLLLDCFMEDMNLIHFQRLLGNSRQQKKGLPLDLAVFLWMHCSCVKSSQHPLSGHFWGKVSAWGLTLRSSVWVIREPRCLETHWISSRVGELAAPAAGTSVKKEKSH